MSVKPVNVLIVDDSAMMRAIIRRAVQLTGVAIGVVHEAGNGREALAILEAAPIDAMFTDVNMPVMNGPELLREMADRDWDHVYRVIVSTDGSDARRGDSSGVRPTNSSSCDDTLTRARLSDSSAPSRCSSSR